METRRLAPVKILQRRSAAFGFRSIANLQRSIERPAPVAGLAKALQGVAARALEFLSCDIGYDPRCRYRKTHIPPWECMCPAGLPQHWPAQHAGITAAIYRDLVHHGTMDEIYVSKQVDCASRTIDTLSQRIAQTRT